MFTALVQTLLLAAGAFVVFALLLSYLKYEQLSDRARKASTAISPRDAFLLEMADRLGIGRRQTPFVVVVVSCTGWPEGTDVVEWTQRGLRRTDRVRLLNGGRLGILANTTADHAQALVDRLVAYLSDKQPQVQVRVGWAAFPQDGESASVLLQAAEAGLGRPAAAAADSPDEEAPLDPLTGVLRPDQIELATHKYVARCRRDNMPVSLMYVDIVQLARINERYGADIGDAVLKNLADILQHSLREEDLIGRLGDDDFLVVAACSPAEAQKPAERVVDRVREAAIPLGVSAVHYAIRMGIAGSPDHGTGTRELFARAEAAWSAARRHGPNAVVVFSDQYRNLLESPSRDHF